MTGRTTALVAFVCVVLCGWVRCDPAPVSAQAKSISQWCGNAPAAVRMTSGTPCKRKLSLPEEPPSGSHLRMSGSAAVPPVAAISPLPLRQPPALALSQAHALARICHMEARWSHTDCRAFRHIGDKRGKRRGEHWLVSLKAYSVPFKTGRTARARAIKSWPWGDVATLSPRLNLRWVGLRKLALRLVTKFPTIKDPCPEATDWNGPGMGYPDGLVRVCHRVPTANVLYAKGRS